MQEVARLFSYPPIDKELEIGAYESLWLNQGMSFKAIADKFHDNSLIPSQLLSDLVPLSEARDTARSFFKEINSAAITYFGAAIHGSFDYPKCLRDAVHPLELLYFRGYWDLVHHPKKIAIIGTRNPSKKGKLNAKKLTKQLVDNGFLVVSGLAKGIDTVVHETAIAEGAPTIAVIGTPITEYYPKTNKQLQDLIARKCLVISQVPLLRYQQQDWRSNRSFFPERNKTMSALSAATVIIEAEETSGTLIQARAALKQKRKLFILASCFEDASIAWPEEFLKKGAIRVKKIADILSALE